jgi:mono/diheme cytochrome c family protein
VPFQYNRQVYQCGTVVLTLCSFLAGAGLSVSGAMEQHIMQPRVPAEKLAEARALTSPLPASADVQAKGKALYEGKATCMTCHGQTGAGDGALAASLNPSPRNFHHHGFWRHRTEGEVFWVIKYGVSGTAMIGFGDQLTDEEIWTIIQYERSFSDGHGHQGGMGPRHDRNSGCCGGQEPNR